MKTWKVYPLPGN